MTRPPRSFPGPPSNHFVGHGFRERERTGADTKQGDLEGDLEFLLRAARFSNLQPRLFPVAVTFLVPRRVARA